LTLSSSDDKNLLTNIAINPYIPKWAGLETEVGEIKGEEGLSTVEEALFLIQGLNAHSIFPDWIALNYGNDPWHRGKRFGNPSAIDRRYS